MDSVVVDYIRSITLESIDLYKKGNINPIVKIFEKRKPIKLKKTFNVISFFVFRLITEKEIVSIIFMTL
jgi:hypothetical protein